MKRIIFILYLVFSLFIVCSCDDETSFSNNYNENSTNYVSSSNILIDLKGEVIRPGIYSIKEGKTLYDVIILAGGLKDTADLSNINLSEVLTKNCMKQIPSLYQDTTTNNNLININTASISELTTLNGIGTSIAQKIIDYRTNNGPFNEIEDIKNVSGIGENVFNKIKDYITV